MHLQSSLLLALPFLAFAHAQDQNPLGSFLSKLSAYFPSSASAPVEAAAAKAADYSVTRLEERNWRNVLTSGETKSSEAKIAEEWWVLITGGNKTCFGLCGKVETAWNESVPLLSATSSPPHLALINCDNTPILCNSWAASAPSIWHILVPHAPGLPTPIRVLSLNTSTTTASDIVDIHTSQAWKSRPTYEGPFHPFDGWIHQYGLNLPLAYVLWAFAMLPSWAFLLVVSFASRTFMGRRMQPSGGRQGGGPAQ